MNNLFNQNTTLIDAENILYTYFPLSVNDYQITKTVPLTLEDTKHLLGLLSNIQDDRLDEYEKIKLTIIVAWVFAIKYNVFNSNYKKDFVTDLYQLPQHHIRYYIELLGSVFEEFSIMTYGHNYYTINGLCAIVDIHGSL